MKKLSEQFKKSLVLLIAMVATVAVVATGTYFVMLNRYNSTTQLTTPINICYSEDTKTISWDKVENTSTYGLYIVNRTLEDEEHYYKIYSYMYSVNEINKVEYDISNKIEDDYNYAFIVRALTEDESKYISSEYSTIYELRQTDPSFDETPEITQE